MPVLAAIRKQFIKTQPLAGMRVAACLHVTTETANLMITLRDGGADIALCASNPLSTQDDVAAALVRDYGIPTFAIKGESNDVYYSHINAALDHKPQITMDDGADVVTALHTKRKEHAAGRHRRNRRNHHRRHPAARDGQGRRARLPDHRGERRADQASVRQSLRHRPEHARRHHSRHQCAAGRLTVVVAGYGWCGRGVAMRARGMGANVIVTEIDPTKAIEAIMDGFRVMTMHEAAAIGDIFVTVTGNKNVIARDHFEKLKSGAILSQLRPLQRRNRPGGAGFACRPAAARRARLSKRFAMRDGRKVYVLGEGRLINLAAAEGHPASVMDMSFANQALSAEYMVKNHAKLEKKVYSVPEELDKQVAKLKLESMGVHIDRLTPEQEEYLAGWSEGT